MKRVAVERALSEAAKLSLTPSTGFDGPKGYYLACGGPPIYTTAAWEQYKRKVKANARAQH